MNKVRHSIIAPVAVLLWLNSPAQSKKEVIEAQTAVMDSMQQVLNDQRGWILNAIDRMEQLDMQLDRCERFLEQERLRYDSLRVASDHAQEDLLIANGNLFVQQRVVSNRLQQFGNGRQGYICTTPFSNRNKLDKLILEVDGRDLMNAAFTFRVIDRQGEEVFSVPIELLLQDELREDEAYQRCAMEARILAFFHDANFSFPPKAAQGGSTFTDQAAWDELRSDSYTSSFTFSISPYESRSIAYSRNLNKVVYMNSFKP